MWNSSSQYSALASRKLRTSGRPKSNTYVPQSGCSPRRGSGCSYSGVPSKRRQRPVVAAGSARAPSPGSRRCPGGAARPRGAAGRPGCRDARSARSRRHLVAPGAAVRVLGQRQQLHVREAEPGHVIGEPLGRLPVAEAGAATTPGAPRTRSSAVRPVPPLAVDPHVAATGADHRRRRRAAAWCATPSGRPCPATRRPRPGCGTCSGPPPHTGRHGLPHRDQRVARQLRRAPLAAHPHRTRTGRPQGEAHAVVARRARPEHLPQPLVPPLGDQVAVQVGERGRDDRGHDDPPTSPRTARNGTGSQSGRFAASYRTSYSALSSW